MHVVSGKIKIPQASSNYIQMEKHAHINPKRQFQPTPNHRYQIQRENSGSAKMVKAKKRTLDITENAKA